MNGLTLLVIGILFLGIGIGYIKVFARKVTMIMLALFSIYIAYQYAPYVNDFIMKKFNFTEAESKLTYLIDEYLDAKVEGAYISEYGEMLSDSNPELIQQLKEEHFVIDPNVTARVNIIRNLEFPDNISDLLVEKAGKYDNTYIEADNFPQYIARFIIVRTVKIGSYLLIFMALDVLYRALIGAKERFKNGMFSGYVNQVAGAVLGAFGAVLVIWVIFAVVKDVPDQSSVAGIVNQINSSKFLTFIQDNNIVETSVDTAEKYFGEVIDMFSPDNLSRLFQIT